MAVVVVALRAGQAAAAVRHGQALLQTLVDTNNTQVSRLNIKALGSSNSLS